METNGRDNLSRDYEVKAKKTFSVAYNLTQMYRYIWQYQNKRFSAYKPPPPFFKLHKDWLVLIIIFGARTPLVWTIPLMVRKR